MHRKRIVKQKFKLYLKIQMIKAPNTFFMNLDISLFI
jgi:hypothetical protein